MRYSYFPSILTILATANALNILVTNDDGFGTALIRAMYQAVKANGHNVYIVASTSDRSGTGGSLGLTTTANLTTDTEFGIVKAGAPSVGKDPNDDHIWYYNGTPTNCVQVALDYIFPNFANFTTPDLVMSGPNYGNNVGDFAYTASGTMGATYYSVGRGIPAIAFSAGNTATTAYYYTNSTTTAGLKDPATIAGILSANIAQQLIKNSAGSRLLPLAYGLNVNIPKITSLTSSACINPPFLQTRLTGGAYSYGVDYNVTTGIFSYKVLANESALNLCLNGDCSLPGETAVLAVGCQSAVSVFSVDYDAPVPKLATCAAGAVDVVAGIRQSLMPLVQYANSTTLVGGLNGTSVAAGNATASASASASATASTTSSTPLAVVTSGARSVVTNALIALVAVVTLRNTLL